MTSEEPPGPHPRRPADVRSDADGAADIVETQVERTELAWARTSLASAALGAVAVHLAFDELGLVLGLAIGALVATPGLVAAWWRIRGLRTSGVPQAPRHEGVAILAGTVALVGAVTLALIVS